MGILSDMFREIADAIEVITEPLVEAGKVVKEEIEDVIDEFKK